MHQLPKRKLLRLKHYDYSQDGAYFGTLCTKERVHFFGKVTDGKMVLNRWGKFAQKCWLEIPYHFPNVILDEYAIMPNHIHGIIIIRTATAEAEGPKIFGSDPTSAAPLWVSSC